MGQSIEFRFSVFYSQGRADSAIDGWLLEPVDQRLPWRQLDGRVFFFDADGSDVGLRMGDHTTWASQATFRRAIHSGRVILGQLKKIVPKQRWMETMMAFPVSGNGAIKL